MRVCLVAPRYAPEAGGVERHVAELAKGMASRGIEVEVAACDPQGDLPARTDEDGFLVHRFPTLGGDATYFLAPRLGAWLIRNAGRFDVIHGHSYHTPVALSALAAARAARVPFALTAHYHGTGHSPFRRALHVPYRPFGRRVVRGARPLICVSVAERLLLQRHFGSDLEAAIAPNGVDAEAVVGAAPLDRPRGRRLVLAVGRLERYKQVDRVIEALRRLPDDHELAVIGTGPARADLEAIIADPSIGGRARLLGHLPTAELHRWLRTADVLVSMSRHEAFGIVLLEAAAAGAGVVASDIAAHREVASYLDPAWISFVPSDAGPQGIADAIARAGRHDVGPEDLASVPRWSDTVECTIAAYSCAIPSFGAGARRRMQARP